MTADKTKKGFQYSILASGSTGNSTYIESGQHKILVDAGLSGKRIEEALADIGHSMSEIDSLLITHEHSDHIKGVGVLSRKYDFDIYANTGTWQELLGHQMLGKFDQSHVRYLERGQTLTLDDIDIESFGVSHDAADPQFYRFMKDGKSFVILTDTGYVSDRMEGIIRDADAYIMESNHDVEILRMGAYPWRTKQRILSDKGHLSNDAGAIAAIDVIGRHTKRIFLGHRSLNNNIKELAHLTMETTLQQHDIDTRQVQVIDTSHERASRIYDI